MKPSPIFLFIAILVATATATPISSQFLAPMNQKGGPKKCGMDPMVCYRASARGSACCGLQCVDTDTNVFNCGKCGKTCKFTEVCCGGKCVDLSYDKRHCGSCFNKCGKGIRCFYGMCNYA